jgi:hypothetical protein
MGFEPPVLDPHAAPPGTGPERDPYVRRDEDDGSLARSVVAMLLALSGGLALLFLFFAAMGAIDVGDAIVATVIAILLGAIWFGAFYYRQRTGAGRVQWRDRERRGF